LGLLGGILKPDLSERDQMAARQSFEAFKELVTRFPDSRYAADSIARMQYIVNTLARSELNVAKYYLRTGACVAAVNRAQTVVQDFPTSESIEEALGILMRCYDTLGLSALRDDNRRILEKNFPNSPLLGKPIVKVAPTADPLKKPWWKLW
jgi:outer membrane protein assembly factor BamD